MAEHNARRDATAHFESLGNREKTAHQIQAAFGPSSYPLADRPQDDWLHFTQIAFKRLRHDLLNTPNGRQPIGSFWSCGSSQGMDAVNAWEILRPTRKMVLTDIMADAVEASRDNVIRNCLNLRREDLVAAQGDLAEPLKKSGIKVDLAYANLPTIPLRRSQAEIAVEATWPSTFYPAERHDGAPPFVRDNLLELYFSFLTEARDCLNPGGMVLCAVGGRLLWEPIVKLFHFCGYLPTIMAFDIKPQAQPHLCLPAYRDLETADRRFHFFPHPLVKHDLYSHVINETWEEFLETTDHERIRAVHDLALSKLRGKSISAHEAADRYHRSGEVAGHLVYLVGGELKNTQ